MWDSDEKMQDVYLSAWTIPTFYLKSQILTFWSISKIYVRHKNFHILKQDFANWWWSNVPLINYKTEEMEMIV